jgi:hypothetical protein
VGGVVAIGAIGYIAINDILIFTFVFIIWDMEKIILNKINDHLIYEI